MSEVEFWGSTMSKVIALQKAHSFDYAHSPEKFEKRATLADLDCEAMTTDSFDKFMRRAKTYGK